MTRSQEIALAYATGTVPVFSTREIASAILDVLDNFDESLSQDIGDALRQAAALLTDHMTPAEVEAEVIALCKLVPGAISCGAHTSALDQPARTYISLPNSKYLTSNGKTWREALDNLRSAIDAADVDAGVTERLAHALLAGEPTPKDIKPDVLARVIDRARARAAEMAQAFLAPKQDAAE